MDVLLFQHGRKRGTLMATNPKLVVLSEPLRGQSFELSAEHYVVGRVESCDICIPDPTMSSKHCFMVRVGDGGYEVQDQGSTNGSRINGIKIGTQKLVNSDILQLGSVELLYDCGAKSTTTSVGTKTGISLAPAGRTSASDMNNLNELFRSSSGAGRKSSPVMKYLFPGLIILIGLGVAYLLLSLIMKFFVK